MLNPGLDIDMWLNIAYTGVPEDMNPMDLDDDISSAFLNSLKNMRSKFPKLDTEGYPFDGKDKAKPKIRQISKQKYLGLKNHLSSNIIGQDAAIESVVSSLKRSQAGLSDNDRPLGVFLFAGPGTLFNMTG
jgi:hypothetical protein